MHVSNSKNRLASKPVALLIAAHPIWNVPPFVNAARELVRHGYSVFVVGYQARELPRYERITSGAWILRLPLSSRRVGHDGARKVLAAMEFFFRARVITARLRPNVLITFNDPAAILQKFTGPRESRTRVTWLLEYPELERFSSVLRGFFRFSASCWERAHIIVAPTRERLALHLALRPECGRRHTLVIQNAPCHDRAPAGTRSERTEAALHFLRNCGSGNIRIIYSGAIGNRYATDSLVRAVGSFSEGFSLLLLGKKHPLAQNEISDALSQTAFPGNIGWIDEIPYRDLSLVLSAGDAGFSTYHCDTLNTRFSAPGKLYEYLKNGLLLLSDDECCLEPEAAGAGCGIFFPRPVTDACVHAALKSLLEKKEVLEEMKNAARNLFESRLSMEKQMAGLIPLLTPPRDGAPTPSLEEVLGQPTTTRFSPSTPPLAKAPRLDA